MTTYTRPLGGGTPTTGQVVKAVHVNDPIDQIYDTILAGGITKDQIAAGAVDTSELATAAVTAAKMDGTIPDGSTLATSAAPSVDAGVANKKYIDDQIAAIGQRGLVKAWGKITSAGAISGTGFNLTSANRDSTGVYTITWDTNFADTNYAVAITFISPSASDVAPKITTQLTGSVVVTIESQGGGAINSAFMISAFGDQ